MRKVSVVSDHLSSFEKKEYIVYKARQKDPHLSHLSNINDLAVSMVSRSPARA